MTLPLEKQVSSLGPSKRLRELGVPQESLFWWIGSDEVKPRVVAWDEPLYEWEEDNDFGGRTPNAISISDDMGSKDQCEDIYAYSAFTVAELGNLIPGRLQIDRYDNGAWGVYWMKGVRHDEINTTHSERADTIADAMAKMLIHLLENHLL